MTSQELQIAVAEKMGWTDCQCVKAISLVKGLPPTGYQPKSNQYPSGHYELPDFPTSLDAIQAACLEKFRTIQEKAEFNRQLKSLSCPQDFEYQWQLTAADWCEAFLATH